MNLNQVTVPVINIADAIIFYEKLGLQLIVEDKHYARFECPEGDSTFSIHACYETERSSTVIYFEVRDVKHTVKKLESKGLIFQKQPTKESWLWEEATLLDTSGNTICLFFAGENRKNPPWRIRSKPRFI